MCEHESFVEITIGKVIDGYVTTNNGVRYPVDQFKEAVLRGGISSMPGQLAPVSILEHPDGTLAGTFKLKGTLFESFPEPAFSIRSTDTPKPLDVEFTISIDKGTLTND